MFARLRHDAPRHCGGRHRKIPLSAAIVACFLATNVHAAAMADPPVEVPPVGEATNDLPPVADAAGNTVDQTGDAVDGAAGGTATPVTSDTETSAQAGAEIDVGDAEGGSQADGQASAAPSGGGTPAQTSSDGASSSASVAQVAAAGDPIAGVGETNAHQGSAGESGAGASSSSLLGHEVSGSHSSSEGNASSQSTSGLGAHAVCEVSAGGLCLGLLYESASSGPKGAQADGVLFGVCLGGQENPSQPCTGPLGLTVGQSASSAGSYSSTLFGACLGGGGGGTTPCTGLGATVLSANESAGGDRDEMGAVLQVGGRPLLAVGHPGSVPDCSEGNISCAAFNDGSIVDGDGTQPSAAAQPGEGTTSADAQGAVVEIAIGDSSVAGISDTGASADGKGSSADATVVSVLGHEVIGAHAVAEDGSSQSETGYLEESCDATGGRVCAAVLYGQASAAAADGGSAGSSDTEVASACAFGTQYEPSDPCSGLLGASILESHSDAQSDGGAASADQWSNGAAACLGGENASGMCDGFGAEVIHSESHSSAAADSAPGSSAESSLLGVEALGADALTVDGAGDIPSGCMDTVSLACVSLGNAATDASAGGTGGSVTAAVVRLLGGGGGTPLIGGAIGDSATAATSGDEFSVAEGEIDTIGDGTAGDEPGTDDPGDAPGDQPGDAPGDQPGDGPGGTEPGGGPADQTGPAGANESPGGDVAGAGLGASNTAGAAVAGARDVFSGSLPFTGVDSIAAQLAAGLLMIAAGLLLRLVSSVHRN